MEPNRHHEYQTHHQPLHPSMQQHHPTHPHHSQATHHQQPIHQHHPPPPPPSLQQQQQSQQPMHQQHPHHYQQQQQMHHHPTSSTSVGSSSSTSSVPAGSYGNHHHAEDQRSRTAMYMNRSTQPGQPGGLQGPGGSTGPGGSDPHLQYYTSNQNLSVKKMPDPHPSWSYKSQAVPAPAPAPGLRHHGNPAIYATGGSSAYWPPADEQQQLHHHQQQQQPARYSYGKPPTGGGGSRAIPGPLPGANSQRYYSEDIKYSTVPAATKVLTYAPPSAAASSSTSTSSIPTASSNSSSVRHPYELEHVVNPSNPSNEHQQPSPNYARKCPPHYETPPEQRSAGATPTSTGTPPTSATTSTSATHHHQSLYMPMPTFSTEKFQTTVHNAIEKYVREAPGPSLEYPRGGGGAVTYGRAAGSYYSQQPPVKSSKATAPPPPPTATSYVKMEPEHASLAGGNLPQPTRSSLYHNPYNVESRERDTSPAMLATVPAPAPAPHGYPTKYGKLIQQQQQHGVGNVGTSSSSTPYTSYYHQGTPSPAAGAVASPTPAPPAGVSGTILGPGRTTGHSPHPQPAPSSTSTANYSTLQVYPHGPDICYHQPGSQSQSQSHPATNPATKKAPAAAKPNYRALINDMLKRSTASEQELNLQIIKKTLNMEAPPRNHPVPSSRVIQQQATPPSAQPVTSAPPPPAPSSAALHSPLDLSMRTVKQTADSTEYTYHQRPSTIMDHKVPLGGGGGGLGLPRFDITPNFSAATRTGGGGGASTTAVIRQAPAPSLPSVTVSTVPHPHPPSQLPVAAAPALVIKSLQQMRPSVLETNPYAKRHPPAAETSTSGVQLLKKPPVEELLLPTPSPSPHNSSNPNYLGRKRHLQEYNQAAAKQARLEAESLGSAPAVAAAAASAPTSVVVVAPVPVIAVNEQALAAKREREKQPAESSSSSSFTNINPLPKMEPRIRTKAELKGFTFTPPPVLVTSTTTNSRTTSPPRTPPSHQLITNNIQIKLEPAPAPAPASVPKAADLGLEDEVGASLGNLLDWGSTCNNLVEQLLSKVVVTVPVPVPPTGIKLEISEDDLPVARILKRQPEPVPVPPPPAVMPAVADAEMSATTQLTTTTNGVSSSLGNGSAQKKLSKVERDKKRLQQEQRIAARLAPKQGQSSSSESDTTELHKRNTARQKKPLLRKGRTRQRSPEEEAVSSDDDDDEDDKEQVQQKKKGSNQHPNRSQTSSEENKTKAVGTTTKKDVKKEAKTPANNKANNSSLVAKGNKKHKEGASGQAKVKVEENQESSSSESHEEDEEEEDEDDEEEEEEEEEEEPEEDEEEDKDKKKEKPRVGRRPAGHTLNKRIAHKLNTMTRSKHRKELELQLANSKVLRNDKIIRNSTTKIKRKYVRKVVDSKKDLMMVTRLRNKRGLNSEHLGLNGRNAKLKANSKGKPGKPTKTSPQQQLYLEEYRYKLALKIPHRLISINKLNKVAASLPDLERRDLGQELACFKRNKPKTKAASKQLESSSQPKSIIDVLHLRVTNGSSSTPRKTSVSAPASTNLQIHSETSQTSASTSLYEHPQPHPQHPQQQQESAGNGDNQGSSSLDDPSRRHFSIFDTKVLQSKTRTESKLQQRREIIREIFVGPERPASAPPECAQNEAAAGDGDDDAISYQKYEEFLQQMNSIVSANDNKLARRSLMEDHPSVAAPQCPHKRKYMRRKGSSGFDYIRKKKRPTQTQNQNHQHNHSQQNHSTAASTAQSQSSSSQLTQHLLEHNQSAADERLDDTDSTIAGSSSHHLPLKIKTEMDVCREIQKWVLNKGVGQSTMHKAARQGLIDVVVYCLDRLNMNPDQKDNAGYTPLHEACTQGWLEIARILLQFGANHSEAAQAGIRPLHGAIENDHEEVVRLLLSYGADPLLATYSGQTPLMLASSKLMRGILRAHLSDAQSAAADIKPMRFHGPWEIFDAKEYGYDIFDNVPNTACDMSRALRREGRKEKAKKQEKEQTQGQRMSSSHSNSPNGLLPTKKEEQEQEPNGLTTTIKQNGETTTGSATKTTTTTTTTTMMLVKLEPGIEEDSNNNKNNDELNAESVENNLVTSVVNVKNEIMKKEELLVEAAVTEAETEANRNTSRSRLVGDEDQTTDIETMDNELNGDIFEFEEADVPLPPLYLLKDEGSDKWVLLNDLCNLLKVKSKDTLLNKLCPNNNNNSLAVSSQKHLLREFKIDDFLEKATCLQLLCAGEKLNMFSSSKVVLIKYNDSVRNLLGVKSILMKF